MCVFDYFEPSALVRRLTVEEHLWFYARLKGMASNLVLGEVDRYEMINLYDAIC